MLAGAGDEALRRGDDGAALRARLGDPDADLASGMKDVVLVMQREE